MTLPVYFLPDAENDLFEAQSWYDGRAFGLGDRFFSAIEELVMRIGRNSLQFPVVHAEIRRALAPRFPYALYFRVEPDGVFVVACAHTSRKPSFWRRRL